METNDNKNLFVFGMANQSEYDVSDFWFDKNDQLDQNNQLETNSLKKAINEYLRGISLQHNCNEAVVNTD